MYVRAMCVVGVIINKQLINNINYIILIFRNSIKIDSSMNIIRVLEMRSK